jgi:hypothetical protein
LSLVGRYPDLLAYELPERAQTKRTGLGQVQYWFYFETRSVDVPLEALPPGEFRAARWVSFDRAVAGSVAFRAPLYKKLRTFARTLRRPRQAVTDARSTAVASSWPPERPRSASDAEALANPRATRTSSAVSSPRWWNHAGSRLTTSRTIGVHNRHPDG